MKNSLHVTKKKPEDTELSSYRFQSLNEFDCSLISCVMFARFRPAHDQLAAKEFLVVQFAHCAFRFFHRSICTKAKPFERWLCL